VPGSTTCLRRSATDRPHKIGPVGLGSRNDDRRDPATDLHAGGEFRLSVDSHRRHFTGQALAYRFLLFRKKSHQRCCGRSADRALGPATLLAGNDNRIVDRQIDIGERTRRRELPGLVARDDVARIIVPAHRRRVERPGRRRGRNTRDRAALRLLGAARGQHRHRDRKNCQRAMARGDG
jgi:hypothetical protein